MPRGRRRPSGRAVTEVAAAASAAPAAGAAGALGAVVAGLVVAAFVVLLGLVAAGGARGHREARNGEGGRGGGRGRRVGFDCGACGAAASRRSLWLVVALVGFAAAAAVELEVMTWNAGGLTSVGMGELDEAATAWPQFAGRPLDVACIQESKLGASQDAALAGFATLRKDVRRGTRGLVTFVRDVHVAVREPRLEVDDTMLVVLPALVPEVWVLSVYRRPSRTAADDATWYGGIAAVVDAASGAGAALLVVGDFNARAFDGAPQPGGRFGRASRAAERQTPASARFGLWLATRPTMVVVSGAGDDARLAFTRVLGADVSELDFVLANPVAAAGLVDCTTENGAVGVFPVAPLTASDHRAVRVAVRLASAAAPRAPPPRVRRVRWATADATAIAEYESRLAQALGAFAASWGASGFRGFGGSADRAARAVVGAIEAAEDAAIGSAAAAPRPSETTFGDRFVSDATRVALAVAETARRTLDYARVERQRSLVAGGDEPSVVVVAHLAEEARAADEHARGLRTADVAEAAFNLIVDAPPGASANVAQRLFATVRAAIDRAPRRAGSTFEFDVLARPAGGGAGAGGGGTDSAGGGACSGGGGADGGGDGDDDGAVSPYVFGAEMRAVLAASMAKMHALDPHDARFCPASFREIEADFARWARFVRDGECAASRRRAGDARHWRAFDRRVARGERPGDAEWRERAAADVTTAEVAAAITAMAAGTAASPGDGVRPAALKHGGAALHRALASLFSRVIATGDVPAVWTVGYVRWLRKSGSELDWLNFRGIVLTSTISKTFERVLLVRLSAWGRNVGAVHHLQAGSNAPLGVTHQIHLVRGAAGARAAAGQPTWIVLIDITRAFPSTTRSFVSARLRRKGMGGAALRAIDGLFLNTARLSVGGGVGYTDAVRRELGVPEGYVLSPLLFSLALAELIEELESLGLGLRVGGEWCGAVGLVDDVALLAPSRDDARAMLDAVALWCHRRRYVLNLAKCAFLCAGPGCEGEVGTVVAWRWSPPPPAAAAAKLERDFTVARVVKYLGVLVSTELTFDAHVEANARRATGELAAARSAVAAFGGLRRLHALVAYVAYGRAYVEWAAPVYGVLSAAARGQLARLHDSAMALVAGVGGDVATFLLGEMPVAARCGAAAARFAFDIAAASAAFPPRAAMYAALARDCGAGGVGAAVADAAAALGLAAPDLGGIVGPRALDAGRFRRARSSWRLAVRRSARGAAYQAALAASASARALVGQAPVEATWRRSFVLQAAVRDAPSALLLRVLADEWELVPEVRSRDGAVLAGVCDLCGTACAGDLAHVLFACPCAELAAVRAPWLAEVTAVLADAGLGAWWAGLPGTLDGRGAAALGRLVEADDGTARDVRAALARAFLSHFGAWWAGAGDGAVARLAVA